jgi:hypothetical protein
VGSGGVDAATPSTPSAPSGPLTEPHVGDSVPTYQPPGSPGNPIMPTPQFGDPSQQWQTPQTPSLDSGMPKVPTPPLDTNPSPGSPPNPLTAPGPESLPSSFPKTPGASGGVGDTLKNIATGNQTVGDYTGGVKPEGGASAASKDLAQVDIQRNWQQQTTAPIAPKAPQNNWWNGMF